MLRYMLDTNTCIKVMNAEPTSHLAGRFNRLGDQIAISTVILAELRFGAENSQRRAHNLKEIELLVCRLAVLDFDQDAAAEFGRVRLATARQPIGPMDTLIAAHARSRGLVLVTDDTRELGRVPGLVVENWIEGRGRRRS